MRFGIALPHYRPNGPITLAIEGAQQAEELGLSSVWTSDHVISPAVSNSVYPHSRPGTIFPTQSTSDNLDPFVVLAILGSHTRSIRLGITVLVVPYRPPIVTANQIATLDALTGGRTILGIGVGWQAEEFGVLGVPFEERGARTDEAVDIWRKLWTGENVSYQGKYTSFPEAMLRPVPIQGTSLPIWVGGDSPAARRRAARYGDAWLPAFRDPERYTREIGQIREQSGGRPVVGALQRTFKLVDRGEAPDFSNPYRGDTGTPDEIIAIIKGYEAAGVDEIVFRFSVEPEAIPSQLAWFGKDVLPAFQ